MQKYRFLLEVNIIIKVPFYVYLNFYVGWTSLADVSKQFTTLCIPWYDIYLLPFPKSLLIFFVLHIVYVFLWDGLMVPFLFYHTFWKRIWWTFLEFKIYCYLRRWHRFVWFALWPYFMVIACPINEMWNHKIMKWNVWFMKNQFYIILYSCVGTVYFFLQKTLMTLLCSLQFLGLLYIFHLFIFTGVLHQAPCQEKRSLHI